MAPNRPATYRLSPKALHDIEDIWRYTAETWSADQADAHIDELVGVFGLVVDTPGLGRLYREIEPPAHIHVHKSHLIVYLPEPDTITVLRVLGGRQNWQAILKAIEP
ncbi:type II toxin-antitoxin system RelE/ParE family toxin [Rhizobium sp. PAMB 3182]